MALQNSYNYIYVYMYEYSQLNFFWYCQFSATLYRTFESLESILNLDTSIKGEQSEKYEFWSKSLKT